MRDLIAGLARPVLRLLVRDDRGAIGMLVAVLISGGVLLGIGVLVEDTGQLYQNRAELQNGADAAALGVARSCALGTCTPSVATSYADANASKLTGNLAGVDLVCGSGSLGGCPASSGAMTDCPASPTGLSFVDVHTSTRTPNGTLLPPVFARTLPGNSNYQGTNVKACAQAEWGPAEQSNSLAFAVSWCEWNRLGANPFGTEVAIIAHGNANPCTGPSGQQLAGGFGWLAGSNCTASLNLSNPPLITAENKPGKSLPAGCVTAIKNDLNTVVFLPVFNNYTLTGNNGTFYLVGLVAFYLNGWINMPSGLPDAYPPQYPAKQQAQAFCAAQAVKGSGGGSNDTCLFGYFTHALVPVGSVIGPGPGFGADVIKLSG
jgi:Flp pilus assembly protein TadG